MKRFLSIFVLSMLVVDGFAASSGRPAMSNKIMSAPRYTASANQLSGSLQGIQSGTVNPAASAVNTAANANNEADKPAPVDMREAERNACINNNIGVGNTFVWASRYSDTSNYAGMVEDIANPQNNVCFVRVDFKSDDQSRVSVADIKPKYFMWGEEIECGIWADKSMLEKRILDAKKGNRIGGIVAASLGGAGIGVGAMELFGNKLIGGKVEGQKNKNLSQVAVYRSQLLTMKNKNQSQYDDIVASFKVIRDECKLKNFDSQAVAGFNCADYKELLEDTSVIPL